MIKLKYILTCNNFKNIAMNKGYIQLEKYKILQELTAKAKKRQAETIVPLSDSIDYVVENILYAADKINKVRGFNPN